MALRVNLECSSDSRWDAMMLGTRSDVYHLAGYHAFEESLGNGDAHLIVVEDGQRRVAWPYLLRAVSPSIDFGSGHTEVTSVYGYPGPLASGIRPGDPFLEVAWAEIRGIWRQQRAVSAFTRFHPLLENAPLAAGMHDPTGVHAARGSVIEHGPTVSIDCSLTDDETFNLYHRSLRQHLRQGRRRGLVTTEDATWTELDTFSALYAETMGRNRAAAHYLLTAEDFARFRDSLPQRVHLLVTRVDGEVAAAGLFTELDGIVEAHLVASRSTFKLLSPTKTLLDDARQWARTRGNKVLHLGGGRGGAQDSLFRFKSEFSPRRHAFFTGRWVLDETAYEQLVAAHAPGNGPLQSAYFPAYRAPQEVLESQQSP